MSAAEELISDDDGYDTTPIDDGEFDSEPGSTDVDEPQGSYADALKRKHAEQDAQRAQQPELERVPPPPDELAQALAEVNALYPYKRGYPVQMAAGLDKLRGLEDRKMAAHLYRLHQAMNPQWDTPAFRAEREREAQAKHDAELQRLTQIASKALAGEYGKDAAEFARKSLIDGSRRLTDEPTLRDFERELIKKRKGWA